MKKDHPFKNTHKIPFTMRLFFASMTVVLKILGAVSPSLAGNLALRLFMTPPKFATPKREQTLRGSASRKTYTIDNRDIVVRSWGEGPTIILSHGWGGRCTQLHAFIEPLVTAGYRVIGFDIPAHGDSSGKHTNMLDAAHILAEVAKKEVHVKAILSHSFGSAAALLAMDRHQLAVDKVILISCFADVFWVTEKFGEVFSMSDSVLKSMRDVAMKKFAHTYGSTWTWDAISPKNSIQSATSDLLIIHDKDDHEVPYSHALTLLDSAPNAELLTTTGFGHRKILMNKECIQATVNFIGAIKV